MRLNLNGDEDGERSHREARARLCPWHYVRGHLKNTLNVFGHIGLHGIPVAVGQLLVHLLGEPLFNQIMDVVYGLETPTPYSLDFKCLGADRQGCRCKTGFDPETAIVCCAGGDSDEHPMFRRFLCLNCIASKTFDTTIVKKLKDMKGSGVQLTDYQQELLENRERRRDIRNAKARKYYRDFVQGTPRETQRQRVVRDGPQYETANRDRSRRRDATRVVATSVNKESRNNSVRYPPDLIQRMCMALLLYVRQYGRISFDSEKLNDVLRRVLIEYNIRRPNEMVVEYYVVEDGRNRPVFFKKEFTKVIGFYMVKGNTDGVQATNGRKWVAIDNNVLSGAQIQLAHDQRSNGTNVTEHELIESVVEEAFAANLRDFRSPKTIRPTEAQVRFNDRTTNNFQPIPQAWIEYTHGIQLSYTDAD